MTLKSFLKKAPVLLKIKQSLFDRKNDDVEKFLQQYFNSAIKKTVIQVGANDGVMSDPLRPFLLTPGNYHAILIEPLPFYVDKLKELYSGRDDIEIVHAAIGAETKTEKLFFIPPSVADTMNGDGPQNNWAHGQGSFDKDTVIYWIEQNKFRGEEYCQQVPFFISSISSIDVSVKQAKEIMPVTDNILIIIDVQGFELDVLKGLDWNNPPAYIMLEDDLDKGNEIMSFLKSRDFKYVCGKSDKVFARRNTC